jgi:hypothetical protein
LRIPPERPTPHIAPSWNVAPTDSLPVVRYDAKDHQRSLVEMPVAEAESFLRAGWVRVDVSDLKG